MSKSDYSENKMDTQPSRIKKKQQQHLAIGIIVLGLLGWVLYVVLSGQASFHPIAKNETKSHFQIDSPTTHVDAAGVWIERTQNELNKTQKNTVELQQQLQLLTAQKEVQEKNNQSQNETMQALQNQLKSFEEKLAMINQPTSRIPLPVSSVTAFNREAPAREDRLVAPMRGIQDDILDLTASKSQPLSVLTLKPSKTPDTFVPAGTFVRAVMLGGADASTGVNSQGNPTPVLFRLLESGSLPNHHHSHLKDCVATAAAIGDISSERGMMRLERLSCVSPHHQEVIELPVEGTVFGPEGKNGVRGIPLWREGALLKRAFVAGTLSGFSEGIASQFTTSSISPSGTVNTINNADIFKYGAAQGVSNAMDKLADYNIRRADQYHPVIQLSAGTIVDIVFLKGFYLDGQKHDNEKESILPPFESTQVTPVSTATAVSSPTHEPVHPLPLTPAQINALQNSGQNVSFFNS